MVKEKVKFTVHKTRENPKEYHFLIFQWISCKSYIIIVTIIFERRVTIRAFEKTGISLKIYGSEDAEKMKFQGQEIGILPGLDV